MKTLLLIALLAVSAKADWTQDNSVASAIRVQTFVQSMASQTVMSPEYYENLQRGNMNDEFYTVNDLIKELGISKSSQAKLRAVDGIPYYKVGNKVFYDRTEISKWIKGK